MGEFSERTPLFYGDRAASCLGKEAFDNPSLAQQVLSRMKRREGFGNALVYRCVNCGKWHIGASKPKRATVQRHGTKGRKT